MKKISLLAVAGVLAFASAAQAAPKTFWFDCTGSTPVQNLDAETFSWSATAPTASYQSGAGCGWADTLLTNDTRPNTLTDAVFGGEYAGEVRKLDLTLYGFDPTSVDGKLVDIDLLVDGETVASVAQLNATNAGGPNQAIGKYTYTLTNLDIPAGTAKSIVLSLGSYNDGAAWMQGAAEVPSNVKLYSFEDLTPDEQCEADPAFCPEEEE